MCVVYHVDKKRGVFRNRLSPTYAQQIATCDRAQPIARLASLLETHETNESARVSQSEVERLVLADQDVSPQRVFVQQQASNQEEKAPEVEVSFVYDAVHKVVTVKLMPLLLKVEQDFDVVFVF